MLEKQKAVEALRAAEKNLEDAARSVENGRLDEASAALNSIPVGIGLDARVKELRGEIEYRQALAEVSALAAAGKWAAADQRLRSLAPQWSGRPQVVALAARIQQGITSPSGRPPSPSPPSRDVDAAERAAFVAFYSGQYGLAADRFETLARDKARGEPGRFLAYAACSRAGAALLKGKAGEEELERARRLYADAGGKAAIIARDDLVSPQIVRALTRPPGRP